MMYHYPLQSGVSAATSFTCIVYSSGSALLRPSSNARWTVGHGVRVLVPPHHGFMDTRD